MRTGGRERFRQRALLLCMIGWIFGTTVSEQAGADRCRNEIKTKMPNQPAMSVQNNPPSASGSGPAATTSNRELVLTRIINAPRQKVFKAWTDPELLKKWFAPRP